VPELWTLACQAHGHISHSSEISGWAHTRRSGGHTGHAVCGLRKAPSKLGGSCELKVFIVIEDRKSCSRPSSGWERSRPLKLGKAKVRAVAFRELDSASLHLHGSGQSAEDDEARIGGEASIRCTCRTPRGERRQRVLKEPSGTWEAPGRAAGRQPWIGNHNDPRGDGAASEGLIVAWIRRSSRRGAKEPWPESSRVRGTGS